MDAWTALGILLLGAGIGALLTAIAYARQVRELREQIHRVAADRAKTQTTNTWEQPKTPALPSPRGYL
jgi:hypothetical protein